jgi:hypothetical protein
LPAPRQPARAAEPAGRYAGDRQYRADEHGNGAICLPHDLPAVVKDRIQVIAQLDHFDAEFQIALVESALTASLRSRLAAREARWWA